MTVRVLMLSATVCALAVPSGCATAPPSSTATEREVCLSWADTLFYPSRADTPQTADWLMGQIGTQADACPGFPPAHLRGPM